MGYKSSVLWAVVGYGEETSPAGKSYWADNQADSRHDIIVLHYVKAGEMIYRTVAEEIPVRPGDLLVYSQRESSSYEKADVQTDYSGLRVNLSGAGLTEHCEELRRQHGAVFNIGKDHPVMLGIERLCTLMDPKEPADPLVMAGAVHRLIMALFAQSETGFSGRISAVNLAIHRIASSPFYPWNLKHLAADCGCSREHLTREFTARYGASPRQYLIQHRTERALYLLQHTALPLSAVASQSGFPNTSALARQIQITTGKSPREHRPVQHIDKAPKGRLTGLFDGSKLK